MKKYLSLFTFIFLFGVVSLNIPKAYAQIWPTSEGCPTAQVKDINGKCSDRIQNCKPYVDDGKCYIDNESIWNLWFIGCYAGFSKAARTEYPMDVCQQPRPNYTQVGCPPYWDHKDKRCYSRGAPGEGAACMSIPFLSKELDVSLCGMIPDPNDPTKPSAQPAVPEQQTSYAECRITDENIANGLYNYTIAVSKLLQNSNYELKVQRVSDGGSVNSMTPPVEQNSGDNGEISFIRKGVGVGNKPGTILKYYIYSEQNEEVCAVDYTFPEMPKGTFSNLKGDLTKNTAEFTFDYSADSPRYFVDISTVSDMSRDVYNNFEQIPANGGSSTKKVIVTDPEKWDQYHCGTTLYWRVYDYFAYWQNKDQAAKSDIQSATVNCPVVKCGVYAPGDSWDGACIQGKQSRARYTCSQDKNGTAIITDTEKSDSSCTTKAGGDQLTGCQLVEQERRTTDFCELTYGKGSKCDPANKKYSDGCTVKTPEAPVVPVKPGAVTQGDTETSAGCDGKDSVYGVWDKTGKLVRELGSRVPNDPQCGGGAESAQGQGAQQGQPAQRGQQQQVPAVPPKPTVVSIKIDNNWQTTSGNIKLNLLDLCKQANPACDNISKITGQTVIPVTINMLDSSGKEITDLRVTLRLKLKPNSPALCGVCGEKGQACCKGENQCSPGGAGNTGSLCASGSICGTGPDGTKNICRGENEVGEKGKCKTYNGAKLNGDNGIANKETTCETNNKDRVECRCDSQDCVAKKIGVCAGFSYDDKTAVAGQCDQTEFLNGHPQRCINNPNSEHSGKWFVQCWCNNAGECSWTKENGRCD